MIAKDLMTAKDFCPYAMIILRQEKSFLIIVLSTEPPRKRSGWRVVFG
jgi:hypothetical protein